MEIKGEEFVRELSRRTLMNYDFIKSYQDEAEKQTYEVFEVTQLINSMYCLLIFPYELFGMKKGDINKRQKGFRQTDKTLEDNNKGKYANLKTYIKDLEDKGRICYPGITDMDYGYISNRGDYQFVKENPVCAIVYNIRNALCHDGVGFLPIESYPEGKDSTQITDVIFRTKLYERGYQHPKVAFIAKLKVPQLEYLMRLIAEMYSDTEGYLVRYASERDEYVSLFKSLEKDARNLLKNIKDK